jgi:hypothetical protein
MVITFVALGRFGRFKSEKTPLEALVPFIALEWPETASISRKSRIQVVGSLQKVRFGCNSCKVRESLDVLVGIGHAMYQKTPLEVLVLSTTPKRAETAVLTRNLR